MTDGTSTSTEDFGGVTLTEDEEVRTIEIDTGDMSADETLDYLSKALSGAIVDDDDDMTLDEEWRVNKAELEGVELPYRESFVTLRSIEAAKGKMDKKTREYRLTHKDEAGEDLKAVIQEAIFREALFQTSVVGWRGFVVEGKEWPFDWKHYCRAWKMVRFRNWIFAEVTKLGTSKSPVLEQLRKN